ncbi:MAG: hypothetical protein RL172_530 [Bacteroidota bacterium]|jgi:cyclophilin family peptidyl-prolyl cis-trans isomerase
MISSKKMRTTFLTFTTGLLLLLTNMPLAAQQKKTTAGKPVKKQAQVATHTALPKKMASPDTAVTRVKITTSMGEIVIKLYNQTPQHRDNFIKLVKSHFYDSLLFHRVINGFMIQGGDPDTKNAIPGQRVGMGGVGYTVPAEFDSLLYHKKGALCAARSENPAKASSGCQFYLVHGKTYNDAQLDMIERANNNYFSPAKRMTYKMLGGTPTLDKNYTVFGQVETGLEVIDKIAMMPADNYNRPLEDVRMRIEVL